MFRYNGTAIQLSGEQLLFDLLILKDFQECRTGYSQKALKFWSKKIKMNSPEWRKKNWFGGVWKVIHFLHLLDLCPEQMMRYHATHKSWWLSTYHNYTVIHQSQTADIACVAHSWSFLNLKKLRLLFTL